jgi:hypothetical protein
VHDAHFKRRKCCAAAVSSCFHFDFMQVIIISLSRYQNKNVNSSKQVLRMQYNHIINQLDEKEFSFAYTTHTHIHVLKHREKQAKFCEPSSHRQHRWKFIIVEICTRSMKEGIEMRIHIYLKMFNIISWQA